MARRLVIIFFCFTSFVTNAQRAAEAIDISQFQGLDLIWNLKALSQPPAFSWMDSTSRVRSLIYKSVDFDGKPTQVFAYYSNPDLLMSRKSGKTFPAVVLIHGGGGKAFKAWVEKWAADGYAAIAMDLGGKDGSGNTLQKAGPDQSHEFKFSNIEKGNLKNVWTYHAVASAILAHSFLLARPEVDANKTAVTGISWGGYLTFIVAGLDNRFKAAVPVYGCGYYDESDAFGEPLSKLTPAYREKWMQYFDPSVYLPYASPSLLFINGNKDRFYNIVPYYKTYKLPNTDKNICLKPDMKHGHVEGWQPVEIKYFFESALNDGVPLPKVEEVKLGKKRLEAAYTSLVDLRSAHFYYATDTTSTNENRVWSEVEVQIDPVQKKLSCAIPDENVNYAFFYITDYREVSVSSPIFVK